MIETDSLKEPHNDAIDEFASFLTVTAKTWGDTVGRYKLEHSKPGDKEAYQNVVYILLAMAHGAEVDDVASSPFVSGTSVIMRYLYSVAATCGAAGLDLDKTAEIAHHHGSYRQMAALAREPFPINNIIERKIGLLTLSEDRDLLRHSKLRDTTYVELVNDYDNKIGDMVRMLYARADAKLEERLLMAEVLRGDRRSGCEALVQGKLRSIYDDLVDIAKADPGLFAATLQKFKPD